MASKFGLALTAFKQKGFFRRIPDIIRMAKAIMKKEYKPKYKNIIIPVLVLVYIISPLDIIPDWIPLIGEVDDIALIAMALPLLMKETERFLEWEKSRHIEDAEIVE